MSEETNQNKTLGLTTMFIALTLVVIAGIAGGVVLTITDKDATTFYGFFTTTLATVVAFGGLARSQGQITETVKRVDANVNGRMSALIEMARDGAQTRKERKKVELIGVESGVIPTVEDDNA